MSHPISATGQPLTREVFEYMDRIASASATSLIGELAEKGNLPALLSALEAGCANGHTHADPSTAEVNVKRSTKVRMKAVLGMTTKANLVVRDDVKNFVADWIRQSGMASPQYLSRQLYRYVKNEHVEAIKIMVDAGAKPLIVLGSHSEDGEMRGYSPLAYAISSRKLRSFMALLRDQLKVVPPARRDPEQDIVTLMCKEATIPSDMLLAATSALFERLPEAVVDDRLKALGREVVEIQPATEFVVQALAVGAIMPDGIDSWRNLADLKILIDGEDTVPLLRYLIDPRTFSALSLVVLGRMIDEGAVEADHVCFGASLLEHGVVSGNLALVSMLVERGANPGLRTADNLDLVQLNRENKNDPDLTVLLEAAIAKATIARVLARASAAGSAGIPRADKPG